jgi:cytochrome c5
VLPRHASAALLLGLALASPGAAWTADEAGIELADGAHRDKVQAACSMCHSLDYVVMNSPFLDRAGWEKTVAKMARVYGAPLTAEESALIVDYLAAHYGK